MAKERNNNWDSRMKSRHFTFVVQDSKIVEMGKNKIGTPLVHRGYMSYQYLHSETIAFFKARGILDKQKPFQAVNIRLNKSGEIKLSKPCACCYNFLQGAGCNKIWFSTEIGFAKMDM